MVDFKKKVLMLAVLILSSATLVQAQPAAASEKEVRDSMKRFSLKIPAAWNAAENAEATGFTLSGEEATIVITPIYRGNSMDVMHRRMALPFAMGALEGRPKKNKVKSDKRRIGELKAMESVFDIKGGPNDPHDKYRIHIITIDGERHKFSIVTTMPLESAEKNQLEERVRKIEDSFVELN